MGSGIRATVSFDAPAGCALAAFSERADAPITHVSTSVAVEGAESVTEFLAATDAIPDGVEAERVFSYGTQHAYRITHDAGAHCPCERLGAFGCPVHRYVAEAGDVTLDFHAADFATLQDAMADLRERFSVDVQRLLQPPLEGDPEERVFVNPGRLTDRQREVLETAYDRGYFERPRRANATELAADLGIAQSTFTEHLVAAQSKLLEDVFGE
ncbi:helix-turn-helix domain-containing protein (plasmid) [Halarchaeum sp. CBA1220]|uniref:helix-turn-helix domain-containing protein n=1 Tax=Halarchaeum sp. CBA1220 TaxID=1853682 RepID=UPI000F3A9127|nr:helix-turn-helix domain-containing protein [Halarchaeum sp. CBA1220]QLC34894.1 helix-turn-helix domain-containing protein [Halarchaeum sp. CBA1220]